MPRSPLVPRLTLSALLVVPAGFSSAETTTVLAATTILSATAAPQIEEYLENARLIKATGDTRVIALSIIRLAADVIRLDPPDRPHPTLLVSEGEVPAAANADASPWIAPVDGRTTQLLSDHILDNAAGYATGSAAVTRRWRGPYVDRLSPDPWGARYAVNVGLLDRSQGEVVLVVSPGPNGIVETPFEAVGLRTGGDDVIALIGRGR